MDFEERTLYAIGNYNLYCPLVPAFTVNGLARAR